MKHFIRNVLTGAIALSCLAMPTMAANGATVEDCAAVARSYGVSETAIQSAFNAYYSNPDAYTSEQLDDVIAALHLYGTDSDMAIKAYFGISDEPSGGGSEPTEPKTETPEPPEQSPTETGGVISDTPQGDSGNSSQGGENTGGDISSSDFISMTIDEKVDYVNSLPKDERGDFIENLSSEERNSIIKQLPIEDKTNLLSLFADAGSAMGLNMTIDDITDDSVSMSIRNQDGVLVDQSSLGVIVEDTGYDYRLILSLVSVAVLTSCAGFWFISRKIQKDVKEDEK